MVVLFEFIDDEPIENVITCMNFRIDKVVYFGFEEVIKRQRKNAENFLTQYCGVSEVVFIPLNKTDLGAVVSVMDRYISAESDAGNEIFFDITGGEDIVLFGFGILAERYDTPVHMYDVPSNRLTELQTWSARSISARVKPQKVDMDLERYIEMRGGKINYALHKSSKNVQDDEFVEDIGRMWRIFLKNKWSWNSLLALMRITMIDKASLNVSTRKEKIEKEFDTTAYRNLTIDKLVRLLDSLEDEGLISELVTEGERITFKFKNEHVRDSLGEGGNVLELHTYLQEIKESDDCKVGVHLDWDGEIHRYQDEDVLNEVDVLSLKGNVPYFISCKGGRLAGRRGLQALYELETVANRFGGKYAKKILVAGQPLGDAVQARARDMDIEVRV